MTVTVEQLRGKQALHAAILSKIRFAHHAVPFTEFSPAQQQELDHMCSLHLIMHLPGNKYDIIKPGKGR